MDISSLFAPLYEMDWYDKSPLVSVLQRNRGRWIHFSKGAPNRDWQKIVMLPEPEKPTYWNRRTNRRYQRDLTAVQRKNAIQSVPKLGINPKSMWQDPKGIYFYPVDWLLSRPERAQSGNQYGLDAPYYYIADINLSDPRGINLDTVTWEQIEAIAKRNGWYDKMAAFRQLPPEEQKEQIGMHYARMDFPGSFFWHFIDRAVKDGQMRWTQAYRGVSFVRDPNLSIIHNNEPDQVLVLDPSIIKIVEFGENKRPIKAGSGADSLEQWWHVLLTVIKRVRGEFGGDLTWMKKRPTLSFTSGVGKFQLTVPERSATFGEVGLSLNYTYGRAEGSMFIGYRDLSNSTVETIVARIAERVNKVANRKTDLLFKPIIPIAEAKQIMTQQMADHLNLTFSTRISNPESSEDRDYSSVGLRGETKREVDRVAIETACWLDLKKTKISGTCNVWVGKHHMISVVSDYQADFTEIDALFANMVAKLRENLIVMLTYIKPREPGKSYMHDRNARFDSNEMMTGFIGWLILNSGLSFGGKLREEFANEIAAFENYQGRNRAELLHEIAYVMNTKW